MRKKIFLCFGLSLLLLCGCDSANNETANTTNSVAEVSDEVSGKELDEVETTTEAKTVVFGQITAINNDVYTIALADQPQGMAQGMPQGGEGETPPEMPEGGQGEVPQGMPQGGEGETPPEMPEGGQGEAPQGMPQGGEGETPPEMPEDGQGEAPQGMPQGGQGQITLNGETKDITIDDSVTITVNGVNATKDDLKVNDIINIEMSGETITSISVGFGGGMQQETAN